MNIFDEMKADVLKKYPKAPWWLRLKAGFLEDWWERSNTVENERGQFTQSWLMTRHKGKEYFVKFGRLPGTEFREQA